MLNFFTIARRLYRFNYWREAHRGLVFLIRAYLHYGYMRELIAFFERNQVTRSILAVNPYPVEQVTRAFFYKGSTFQERLRLIEDHFSFLRDCMPKDTLIKIYSGEHYPIWQATDDGSPWRAVLGFGAGQRKEGLLSIVMDIPEGHLYQMMFWIAKNKSGKWSLFIGAMQGPNMGNAREIVKDITKRSHRYRTKNLILYMTQAVARSFGMEHIYAVSNKGYYAMNHLRIDRKLKTDFGTFWEEVGGHITEDQRFYELPLKEHRKTMDEIPTRKRATYRKRFTFQDDVDGQIEKKIKMLHKD